MKKFVRKITGKSKGDEPGARSASSETELPPVLEQPVPPALIPQNPVVTNGSMRRPRRPKETVDRNYADYAPFAPHPQLGEHLHPVPGYEDEQQQQMQRDIELARQLALAEMAQHPTIPAAQLLAPTPALVAQQQYEQEQYAQQVQLTEEAHQRQREEEAQREAAYQAELEAVLAESVLQADYDNILREIKLWGLDLTGALDDVAEAQREAQHGREEVDMQLAAVSPDDEAGWQQVMWLSRSYAEMEARLQELGWRLKPIHNAVEALRNLDAYIRSDQPSVEDAQEDLDRIIAKLLEELNVMGFAFHHPIAPFGRQDGEGSSRDVEREAKPGDPLRELVHSLIQETKRASPQPRPRPPSAETLIVREEAGEGKGEGHEDYQQAEGKAEGEASASPEAETEPPQPPSPLRDEASVLQIPSTPEPPQIPSTPEPPQIPSTPEPPQIPTTPEPPQVPTTPEPPQVPTTPEPPQIPTTPEPSVETLPPQPSAAAEPPEGEGECVTPRAASVSPLATSVSPSTPGSRRTGSTPGSTEATRRRRSSGIKPLPEDSIKRLPRVVALYHEMQKGVVAETVGWNLTKPGASRRSGQGNSTGYPGAFHTGGESSLKFTPTMYPTRMPPSSTHRAGAEGERTGSDEAEAAAAGSNGEAMSPSIPLSPSDQALCAAQIATFKPETLQQACDFVEELAGRGVPTNASGASNDPGWPREKWGTLCEAAEVAGRLRVMATELSQWTVDAKAGTIAESHRLASYIDAATKEVGRVSYAHDPLRVRLAKEDVPWDSQLVVDLRWAAQHAAAELMTHALEEAKVLGKSKKWQAQAVLQPLGHAAMGAFKVHQFCGGLNNACTALFDQLQERTIHYARLIDHHWLRNTKWA